MEPRIPPIVDAVGLDPHTQEVAAGIVESRGAITRPFQVLLHVPELAGPTATLGQAVRTGSHLGAADRELATLATGRARGCAFVWDSHVEAARAAGLDDATIAALDAGREPDDERAKVLATFVRELCAAGRVPSATFGAAQDLIGTPAVVELSLVVGYYTMLGLVMGAAEEC